ncbi:hypothetical protein chiPu_0020168, partial [Chiloscyllium punctatum]|nr:hypothetical protein [Chiloscyllium punctatum]
MNVACQPIAQLTVWGLEKTSLLGEYESISHNKEVIMGEAPSDVAGAKRWELDNRLFQTEETAWNPLLMLIVLSENVIK